MKIYVNITKCGKIIEIIEVHGKTNFQKYRDFLNLIKVENYIISDLDYIFDIGINDFKRLFMTDYQKIEKDIIKDKKSQDTETLTKIMEKAIKSKDCNDLERFWEYLKSRKRKLRNDLSDEEKISISTFISDKRNEKIFILEKGEIEDYLPNGFKDLEKLIELTEDKKFIKWIIDSKTDEGLKELKDIIFSILNVEPENINSISQKIDDYFMN